MSQQNKVFSVPGMHCSSCPKLIKVTVSEIYGVDSVSASLDTKTAVVDFDDTKTSVSEIINSIKEIGYTAVLQ